MAGYEPDDPWGDRPDHERADAQPGGMAPRPAPWGRSFDRPDDTPVGDREPSGTGTADPAAAPSSFPSPTPGGDHPGTSAFPPAFDPAAFGPPAVDPPAVDPPAVDPPAFGPPGARPSPAPSVPGSPLPTQPATRAPAAAAAAAGFDADSVHGGGGPAPSTGFRRLIYALSGRRINLGPSSNDTARDQLLARARTPAATGRRRIAMISLKGGVGKTTTTVMLGHTLADVRGDNVIAIDANPDAGNLAQRIRRQSEMSARDLLNATGSLERYADVRTYTSQADSRLEVLAGEADPALSEAFSSRDYEHVLSALERFYSIVLTDCGTGILHDAMRAVLWYADQLVVVTSPAVDSANALGQLLEWLERHGHHVLVESGIVVVNGVHKHSAIRPEQFDEAFGRRCRAVVRVPYDPALSTGGVVSLEALQPATRRAYLDLAAAVGDGFSTPRALGHDPSDNSSGGLY